MAKKEAKEAKKAVGRVGTADLIDEVVEDIAASTDHTLTKAEISDVVRSVMRCIGCDLSNHKAVAAHNMFILEPVYRQGRTGRNPQKPEEEITIPAQWTVRLRLSKTLKSDMNA